LRELLPTDAGFIPLDLLGLTPEEFQDAVQSATYVAIAMNDAIDLVPTGAPSH